jgi:hypothetical protein
MDASVMFLDCPEYLDAQGAARCGLPAEVEDRYTVESTDGPLESARIRCPRGHFFNGPLESLTWERSAQPAGEDSSPSPSTGSASARPIPRAGTARPRHRW